MKPSEIEVGKTYSNGKKREAWRQVLKIRPNPDYIDPLVDLCVHYKILKGIFAGEMWITLTSFARWAKSEVKDEG